MDVILFNFGNEDFIVNMGDRIAQLIFEKIKTPTLKETVASVCFTAADEPRLLTPEKLRANALQNDRFTAKPQ